MKHAALLLFCSACLCSSACARTKRGGSLADSAASATPYAAGSAAPGPHSDTGAVALHGALHVSGNRVIDASGEPVQLRGMSLFWSQWSNFYQANTVDQLANDWQATLVRAVLGVENGGYLMSQAANEAKIITVADRAIAQGIYVIIDWHDHHAQDHQAAAVDFFTRMARKYGNEPGVLFEIYNEPMQVGWPAIKAYAETVIAAIRAAGAHNLVIVGTPNWSQDVDVAAADPITVDDDVAYTLHFYAATHKQWLRDKAQRALDAGLPLFVTEWGTCASNGDGMIDAAETQTWLDFLADNQISWANWALNDKAESSSALSVSAGTNGPWGGSALTASGMLVKAAIP
jgi:endoglucanase